MAVFVNIADLVDTDDPQQRTHRQINAEKRHSIPVGALVEILPYEDSTHNGVRMFVALHARDCDQTPLYWLSPCEDDLIQKVGEFANRTWIGGFDEGSLVIIRLPAPKTGND
ncbi:MAG TPA: hypothetical protein VGH74_16350 [Planctomycetaceae bacterium]|jgi:hypothetical protein